MFFDVNKPRSNAGAYSLAYSKFWPVAQTKNNKMKLSVFIIDLILILSIFVPYYLFIRAGRKGRQLRNKIIDEISRNRKILPNIHEQWGNYYIGIDSLENSLIHIQFVNREAVENLIPLNKVSDCSLIQEYKGVRKGKGKEDVLNFLAIEFRHHQPGTAAAQIVFYDSSVMAGEDYEMQRAQKWLGVIKEHLKTRKPGTVAA